MGLCMAFLTEFVTAKRPPRPKCGEKSTCKLKGERGLGGCAGVGADLFVFVFDVVQQPHFQRLHGVTA